MKLTLLCALLWCGAASANGLDDMRAALAQLTGQAPLRGAYEVQETKNDLESKTAKGPQTTLASAMVYDDANGLEVRWERGLLKRAADEASPARGANRKDALSNMITQVSATKLAAVMNYAPRLLQTLTWSQFRSERNDSYQGKPARLVEVGITPQEVPNDNVSIKDNTLVAQFWIGPDGMPLAASTVHSIKAKFMVFISYEKTTKEEFTFSVVNNRLVVLKRESQGKEKGPGSDTEFRNVYTFTPKG